MLFFQGISEALVARTVQRNAQRLFPRLPRTSDEDTASDQSLPHNAPQPAGAAVCWLVPTLCSIFLLVDVVFIIVVVVCCCCCSAAITKRRPVTFSSFSTP